MLLPGYVINRNVLTHGLNVRANVVPAVVDGVDFYVNGGFVRTELHPPYSLGSNTGTSLTSAYLDTLELSINEGAITIRAEPWFYHPSDPSGKLYGRAYEIAVVIQLATPPPTDQPTRAPVVTNSPTKLVIRVRDPA